MSSEKKPGFWQRLFGSGPQEPPKKEPPAPKPANKEPDSKPAQKEPPERKKPPKKAEGAAQAKKSAKLKAPPPAGPHIPTHEGGPSDDGPKGPKPGGGKRPRKPKSEAPAAPPPAAPATREGTTPPEERHPPTREKGTPDEPDLPVTEPQKPEDDKPSKASAESAPAPRRSWFTQLRSGLARTSSALGDNLTSVLSRRKLDAETLDELEDALIRADLGVPMAARIRSTLASTRHDRALSPLHLREVLAAEVAKVLSPVAQPFTFDKNAQPHVVLLVGVNGTGKTTTAAKMAHRFIRDGSSVMLAAADTFRAAAIDQLKVWGGRVGAEMVARGVGADSAGVAYEALERAKAEKLDVLIIDTAGRLQNKSDLMAELAKIVRVLKKLDPQAPQSVVLVLDATTGQNALNQVQIFQEIAGVTSLVVTKLDGTARGGILVAVAERFGLPVNAIGVGEGIDDLQAFNAEEFARAIAGLDASNAEAA